MIQNFFLGILIAGTGACLVIYTEAIMSFTGRMDWADQWLGMYGGSRLGIKLVGIAAVIIGFLLATGLLGPIVLRLFGGLFSGFGPTPSTDTLGS